MDTFERLCRIRDPLIPPRGLWFVGGGQDYKAINEEFLRYMTELCGLSPHSQILDVGCGIGVTASRLASYLAPDGSYSGFDIVRRGITWCQKCISARYPNFSFVHADIFSTHYNPKGLRASNAYRFPYLDEQFDFILSKSVFTHMMPSGIQNYLGEISRTLKRGGKCLATFFLLTDESNLLIRNGRSSLALRHDREDCRVLDPQFPETAVGVPESSVKTWCSAVNLQPIRPVLYGSWSGRPNYTSYQDIMILEKTA